MAEKKKATKKRQMPEGMKKSKFGQDCFDMKDQLKGKGAKACAVMSMDEEGMCALAMSGNDADLLGMLGYASQRVMTRLVEQVGPAGLAAIMNETKTETHFTSTQPAAKN